MRRSPDAAANWQAWKYDFTHGRTHTAYGLIASTLASAYGVLFSAGFDSRLAFVISLTGSLGGLVDTVAHLFYH